MCLLHAVVVCHALIVECLERNTVTKLAAMLVSMPQCLSI